MDLLLTIARDDRSPLHGQVTEQLRRAILDGRLAPAERLPSTRDLAEALGVSRGVVVAAYDELVAEGYLTGRQGSGSFVAEVPRPPLQTATNDAWAGGSPRWLAPDPPPDQPGPDLLPGAIEFRPGRPSIAPFPATVWRRLWRAVGDVPPPGDYGPPAGDPALRSAIAAYLGRARGVRRDPGDAIVTTGAVQAIDLIARATVRPGTSVGVEEPGPPPARAIFAAHAARVVPLPVDGDGLRVDRLPAGAAAPAVLYVTPSHQYPLGGRLPVGRRLALLAWAAANDALIVEDDYDSEFRYDAAPLPALAGLAGSERVAYVGTFSKVLSPALRCGYVVAPPLLRERIAALKPTVDYHTPWPVQRALTVFLDEGHLERHVRRMRRHYARARGALLAALAPVRHLATPIGLEAGLHACLAFRQGIDDGRVARAARAAGVVVMPLAACFAGPPDRAGLVVGYGGLTEEEIARGTAILMRIIRQEAADLAAR